MEIVQEKNYWILSLSTILIRWCHQLVGLIDLKLNATNHDIWLLCSRVCLVKLTHYFPKHFQFFNRYTLSCGIFKFLWYMQLYNFILSFYFFFLISGYWSNASWGCELLSVDFATLSIVPIWFCGFLLETVCTSPHDLKRTFHLVSGTLLWFYIMQETWLGP